MNTQPHRFRTEDRTDAHDTAPFSAQTAQASAQEIAPSAQLDAQIFEGELVEENTGISHGAPYSSRELAEELGIADSTLRTRWLPWLRRVAPVELLLEGKEYTELARSLLTEFAQVPSKKTERERWVTDAKRRYSREFMPGGVTPEGVPEELGGALALLRHQNNTIQSSASAQFADIKQLITRQATVEAEFDSAEIEAMRASGMKRGVRRFQIETEEEDSTYYQLRKLRSEARGSQSKG
ncbi:MAG: hypothetical protein WBA57_14170 [Elainellaceae cyanobacterium]